MAFRFPFRRKRKSSNIPASTGSHRGSHFYQEDAYLYPNPVITGAVWYDSPYASDYDHSQDFKVEGQNLDNTGGGAEFGSFDDSNRGGGGSFDGGFDSSDQGGGADFGSSSNSSSYDSGSSSSYDSGSSSSSSYDSGSSSYDSGSD